MIVLSTIQGKDSATAKAALSRVKADHTLLVDFKEKDAEFAKACEKYSPKFEVV